MSPVRRIEQAAAALEPASARDLVMRALEVARAAHAGQTRDEGSDYLEHPARVALILLEERGVRDPVELAAALCHDVLEDSPMAAGELGRRTDPKVGEIVAALTKDPIASDLTGEARVAAKTARDNRYYHHIATSELAVRRIKCADRLDNLRGVHKSPEPGKPGRYAAETRDHLLPIAKATDEALAAELEKLVARLAP